MHYPDHLLRLIDLLRRLPGVGSKSAERFAFHLLQSPGHHLDEMASVLTTLHEKVRYCLQCGCLSDQEECLVCANPQRQRSLLCIIAHAKDAYAIEETRQFHGLFHVLGSLLSPIEGKQLAPETVAKLKERIISLEVKEVIVALDATVEGDATALFLKKELSPYSLTVSRIAFGLPMGSSLDYVDGGTLARALLGRRSM